MNVTSQFSRIEKAEYRLVRLGLRVVVVLEVGVCDGDDGVGGVELVDVPHIDAEPVPQPRGFELERMYKSDVHTEYIVLISVF